MQNYFMDTGQTAQSHVCRNLPSNMRQIRMASSDNRLEDQRNNLNNLFDESHQTIPKYPVAPREEKMDKPKVTCDDRSDKRGPEPDSSMPSIPNIQRTSPSFSLPEFDENFVKSSVMINKQEGSEKNELEKERLRWDCPVIVEAKTSNSKSTKFRKSNEEYPNGSSENMLTNNKSSRNFTRNNKPCEISEPQNCLDLDVHTQNVITLMMQILGHGETDGETEKQDSDETEKLEKEGKNKVIKEHADDIPVKMIMGTKYQPSEKWNVMKIAQNLSQKNCLTNSALEVLYRILQIMPSALLEQESKSSVLLQLISWNNTSSLQEGSMKSTKDGKELSAENSKSEHHLSDLNVLPLRMPQEPVENSFYSSLCAASCFTSSLTRVAESSGFIQDTLLQSILNFLIAPASEKRVTKEIFAEYIGKEKLQKLMENVEKANSELPENVMKEKNELMQALEMAERKDLQVNCEDSPDTCDEKTNSELPENEMKEKSKITQALETAEREDLQLNSDESLDTCDEKEESEIAKVDNIQSKSKMSSDVHDKTEVLEKSEYEKLEKVKSCSASDTKTTLQKKCKDVATTVQKRSAKKPSLKEGRNFSERKSHKKQSKQLQQCLQKANLKNVKNKKPKGSSNYKSYLQHQGQNKREELLLELQEGAQLQHNIAESSLLEKSIKGIAVLSTKLLSASTIPADCLSAEKTDEWSAGHQTLPARQGNRKWNIPVEEWAEDGSDCFTWGKEMSREIRYQHISLLRQSLAPPKFTAKTFSSGNAFPRRFLGKPYRKEKYSCTLEASSPEDPTEAEMTCVGPQKMPKPLSLALFGKEKSRIFERPQKIHVLKLIITAITCSSASGGSGSCQNNSSSNSGGSSCQQGSGNGVQSYGGARPKTNRGSDEDDHQPPKRPSEISPVPLDTVPDQNSKTKSAVLARNYKRHRKKAHGAISNEQFCHCLGQAGSGIIGLRQSSGVREVDHCMQLCLHETNSIMSPSEEVLACCTCAILHSLLSHFTSNAHGNTCSMCLQLFTLVQFHVQECLASLGGEHREEEDLSSNVCHKMRQAGLFADDAMLACRNKVWVKVRKYLSAALAPVLLLDIDDDPGEDTKQTGLDEQAQSHLAVTASVDRDFQQEAPPVTPLKSGSDHLSSVPAEGTPQNAVGTSKHDKLCRRPSNRVVPQETILEEPPSPNLEAASPTSLPQEINEHDITNFTDPERYETEDPENIMTIIRGYHMPDEKVPVHQYDDPQKTYGCSNRTVSMPEAWQRKIVVEQTLSVQMKPTVFDCCNFKPRFSIARYMHMVMAASVPGIGEVVYGTNAQLLLVARNWAQERNECKASGHCRYQHREEGVILHAFKENLKILHTRYQKHQQWERLVHLGNGVTGKCHLCIDRTSNFKFCCKKVHILHYEDQELNIWSELNHPNIVRFFGAIRHGEKIYLFAEFIDGGSLTAMIKEQWSVGKRLSHWMVLNYFRQLLQVLTYLQSMGVLHEDIKADNLLVRQGTTEIALTDFGSAQRIPHDHTPPNRYPTGSPAHWSPEKASSEGHGFPSDLWASACVLIHMLSGNPPWISRYPDAAILNFLIWSKPPPLEDIPNNVNEKVRDLIASCLIKDKAIRPTAQQILTHPAFQMLTNTSSFFSTFAQPPCPDYMSSAHNQVTSQPLQLSSDQLEEGAVGGSESGVGILTASTTIAAPLFTNLYPLIQATASHEVTVIPNSFQAYTGLPCSRSEPQSLPVSINREGQASKREHKTDLKPRLSDPTLYTTSAGNRNLTLSQAAWRTENMNETQKANSSFNMINQNSPQAITSWVSNPGQGDGNNTILMEESGTVCTPALQQTTSSRLTSSVPAPVSFSPPGNNSVLLETSSSQGRCQTSLSSYGTYMEDRRPCIVLDQAVTENCMQSCQTKAEVQQVAVKQDDLSTTLAAAITKQPSVPLCHVPVIRDSSEEKVLKIPIPGRSVNQLPTNFAAQSPLTEDNIQVIGSGRGLEYFPYALFVIPETEEQGSESPNTQQGSSLESSDNILWNYIQDQFSDPSSGLDHYCQLLVIESEFQSTLPLYKPESCNSGDVIREQQQQQQGVDLPKFELLQTLSLSDSSTFKSSKCVLPGNATPVQSQTPFQSRGVADASTNDLQAAQESFEEPNLSHSLAQQAYTEKQSAALADFDKVSSHNSQMARGNSEEHISSADIFGSGPSASPTFQEVLQFRQQLGDSPLEHHQHFLQDFSSSSALSQPAISADASSLSRSRKNPNLHLNVIKPALSTSAASNLTNSSKTQKREVESRAMPQSLTPTCTQNQTQALDDCLNLGSSFSPMSASPLITARPGLRSRNGSGSSLSTPKSSTYDKQEQEWTTLQMETLGFSNLLTDLEQTVTIPGNQQYSGSREEVNSSSDQEESSMLSVLQEEISPQLGGHRLIFTNSQEHFLFDMRVHGRSKGWKELATTFRGMVHQKGFCHFTLMQQDGQTPVDYFSTYDPSITSVMVIAVSEQWEDVSSVCWCSSHLVY